MAYHATTQDEWLRVQQETHHRHIVAVKQTLTLTPSLYFGTRRCTYSNVMSVVTTVKPLPRCAHDTTQSPKPTARKSTSTRLAWEASSPKRSGNGTVQYMEAPLEGDRDRDQRFLASQAYALAQERAMFLAAVHTKRKQRFLLEQSAVLVIQRVYRGFLLRRRFRSIKEKLRVRKRIRVNLIKVTKGTAIITGEKDRKARILADHHVAAQRIQCVFRRWRCRGILTRERIIQIQELHHSKAIAIQRTWRKAITKAVAWKLRARRSDEQRHRLARVVSRVYRGYVARQHVRRIRLHHQLLASHRIQDAVRRFHARKALGIQKQRRQQEHAHRAARTIQQLVRGVLTRARMLKLRLDEYKSIRVACALTIQRVVRGFRGRQRMRFVRLFAAHSRAWHCGLHVTRIVRGYLGRQRAKCARLDQETDLLVQIVKGNTSAVTDLLDGYGLVDEPVDLTTTNLTTKNHALHLACRHGHMAILTFILPKFLETAPSLIYAVNANSETPLDLAVYHGHEKLASFLLTKTSGLFRDAATLHPRAVFRGRRERSLLLDAARNGLGTIVAKLMVLFPSICTGKERDAWSHRTLLHEALLNASDSDKDTSAMTPHIETFSGTLEGMLAKLSVDLLNAQDRVGFTPLHLAAMHGNTQAVQSLLEKGADVTIRDREDRTAWRLALLHGHDACFLAIRHKWLSDIARETNGASELNLAKALTQAATRGRNGLVADRRRVAANLQPHLNGDVLEAARANDLERVRFLLEECFASANACDPNGEEGDSLLMVVLYNQNLVLLRYLLNAFLDELDFTYVNKTGRSVLDVALKSPRLMQILVHEGYVNPCLPLLQHRTVSHEAVRRGYDLRAWLRGYAFTPSMLVPLVDDAGRSLLHEAAAVGNVAACRLLLNAGGRADVPDTRDQRTPLHDACRSGAVTLVREMLRKTPEALWLRDAAGQLPIEAAAALANRELLTLLVHYMRPGLADQPPEAFLALEKLLDVVPGETWRNGQLETESEHEKGAWEQEPKDSGR